MPAARLRAGTARPVGAPLGEVYSVLVRGWSSPAVPPPSGPSLPEAASQRRTPPAPGRRRLGSHSPPMAAFCSGCVCEDPEPHCSCLNTGFPAGPWGARSRCSRTAPERAEWRRQAGIDRGFSPRMRPGGPADSIYQVMENFGLISPLAKPVLTVKSSSYLDPWGFWKKRMDVTSNSRDPGSIPGQGTRSCMWQGRSCTLQRNPTCDNEDPVCCNEILAHPNK
ncbi:uncharacterized protein LOC130858624 [Hippopotamus amphibius kiboko]|uniref:uncharacterized protein LOC130858624 n=1 Tax=Hippopotamus amphibius kiboko TaxID=575201 RepID=UPI002595546A|nr:uncharacterized protein LOC130858624 [Hippopotamus amphibius kiboko]